MISLLVTTGRSSDSSLSHVIVGGGFPLNTQVRVTLACSRTGVETGLDKMATPTGGEGGRGWIREGAGGRGWREGGGWGEGSMVSKTTEAPRVWLQ